MSGGWRLELAGSTPVADWEAEARALFNLPDGQVQSIQDSARGTARVAFHAHGKLIAALFVSRTPVAVMRDYLAGQVGMNVPDVLTGMTPADKPNPGPVLCACFGVGVNTILNAIETDGLMSVDAIGAALSAGTNCGSCKPELGALLERVQHREAAE